jgi:hypothetical protein
MSDTLAIIGKLVQIGKTLRDVADLVKDAQTKNLIADLNLVLADLKMQVAELQEENLSLKGQVRTLQAQDDHREKLELRDYAYWFSTIPAGRPAGPYCTCCFDSSEKLILLRELTAHFRVFGKYECPACKSHYGK